MEEEATRTVGAKVEDDCRYIKAEVVVVVWKSEYNNNMV